MKALTKISIGFLALAAVALWFTSCSSEDVASGTNQGKMSSLTLTINTGKSMGSRATGWDKDPGAKENQINRIAIGIFSKKDNTLRTIVELTPGTTGDNNTFKKETDGSATTTIVTNSLADGDLIKVAVNAPKGHFVGVKNASDFQGKSEDASVALLTKADDSQETTKEACSENVPMYGEGTLTPKNAKDNSEFKVSENDGKVIVKHMLAKVSLESIAVDFKDGSAYANASFTPVAVFLINVPNKMDFTNDVWKSGVSFLHGWSADASPEASANVFDYTKGNATGTGDYKPYLTTEGFAGANPLKKSSSYASKTYFYTIPNDNVDDETGTGTTSNTKLVVAGKFVEKDGGAAEVVYYSLPINATYNSTSHKYELPGSSTGKTYQVCPNYFYKCSVTIRTKGSSSPNINLTPQAAEIKVKVSPFTPVTQSAEFN